jgi:heat shock protein HslJ
MMSTHRAVRLLSTTRRVPRIASAVASVSLALGCATLGRYSADLENREWRLVELRGRPAVPSTGMRQAGIRFSPDSMRMSGSGGCNRMSGTYSRDGDRLSFGPILATKMACADARLNQQEMDFVSALQATTRYEIINDTLMLARDGERLARLGTTPR